MAIMNILLSILIVLYSSIGIVESLKINNLRNNRVIFTSLTAKKDKNKTFKPSNNAAPSKSEKQGKEDRFDAMTRKFMFTIQKLNKVMYFYELTYD